MAVGTASPMALPVWRGMLQLCLPRADSLQVVLVLKHTSYLLLSPCLEVNMERNRLKMEASFFSEHCYYCEMVSAQSLPTGRKRLSFESTYCKDILILL